MLQCYYACTRDRCMIIDMDYGCIHVGLKIDFYRVYLPLANLVLKVSLDDILYMQLLSYGTSSVKIYAC